jgi:hypothetical protein
MLKGNCTLPCVKISVQQRARLHPKRPCQPLDDHDSRVPRATLDITDIGPVDAGLVGERFLTPALCLTEAAHILAEAGADIHVPTETALSTINLQTMRDN